jgi:hypothetical protein
MAGDACGNGATAAPKGSREKKARKFHTKQSCFASQRVSYLTRWLYEVTGSMDQSGTENS